MLDAGAEGGPVRSCTGAGDVELELVVGDVEPVELELPVEPVELDLVVGDVELEPDLARIVTLEGLDVIVDPLELAVAIAVSDTFPLLISALVTV